MRARGQARHQVRTIGEWLARIVLFGVLVFAGLLKFNRPGATAEFLDSLLQVHSITLVRAIGLAEVSLALVIISGVASLWTGRIVVALFTMFAMTHALAASGGNDAPACGCLGTSDLASRIPPWAWIAANMTFALLGGLIAWSAEQSCPAPERRESLQDASSEVAHG